MSDKIFLKDITLPIIETGENETYSFVQTDSDLETAGDAADAKKTGDEITQLKADLTDIETDISTGNLTAGTSEQLLADTGMTDKSPYLFRAMPTGSGDREEPVIVGGSVGWNQQAYNGNFESSDGWRAYSSSYGSVSVENNIATLTYSQAGTGGYNFGLYQGSKASFVKTHKYLVRALVNPSFAMSTKCELGGADVGLAKPATANTWNTFEDILNAGANGSTFIIKPVGLPDITVGSSIQFKKIVISDLTAMFGTAVADYVYALEQATTGSGIAWLKKYGFFTQDYYPYTEPTFKHVEGLVSHRMVGFNQWDEDAEVGGFRTTDGTATSETDRIRSKNYIMVVPNTTYCLTGARYRIFFYDADKQFIGYIGYYDSESTFNTGNAHYIRFQTNNEYGTTYNHDICLNLSDPAKNGTYEPYKEYTYPLGSDVVLRGYPKLDANNNLYFDGDTYKPDGTVSRRYGIVDLGTLDWGYYTGGANALFYASISGGKTYSAGDQFNALCSMYESETANSRSSHAANQANKTVSVSTDGTTIYIRDDTYSDAATFKTAMSGAHIVYEKATPTTETATPYAPLQLADPYGTEEWVLDDGAFPMPVGQETFYPENLRAKIEGLPWNFASLIAPTEATLTATRNYTAGNLLIVDNVLYKVTVNIANGGAITPGTNVTATTLAEIISALQ